MKKIAIFLIAFVASVVMAESVYNMTQSAEAGTTSTWVNNVRPQRDRLLKGAVVKFGSAVTNATLTASISDGGVTFASPDSGSGCTNSTADAIDFIDYVVVGYGETVTVTRATSATSTNTTMDVILTTD